MTFGQQLQSMRKEKGLSQDTLAKQLFVTRQSVSQWENDKAMPSVDLLVKLSRIFDISVDRLLGKDYTDDEPVLTARIITDKKKIKKASRFRFCSTVTLLLSATVALVVLNILKLSIFPAIYGNLPYELSFVQAVDIIFAAICALTFAVVLLILRIRFGRRASSFANCLSGNIEFFYDNLIITDKSGEATSFFYANLRRIYENDAFLYITLPNKQTIILDKSSLAEGAENILLILSRQKKYKRKAIMSGRKSANALNKLRALQIANNILVVMAITSALCFFLIQIILKTNGEIPKAFQWMLFLIPWVVSLFAVVFGIVQTVKKIRAKRLIFAGASSLFIIVSIFALGCMFTLYNFNQKVLSADEYLAVMEENNFTVRETNRDNPDDYLWECYSATDPDGDIEISFMHFTEDLRWDAVRSARGAYERLLNGEIAKTDNANLYYYLDQGVNAFRVLKSGNGRYSYVSLNRYTVICVSAPTDKSDETEKVLSRFKLDMPH